MKSTLHPSECCADSGQHHADLCPYYPLDGQRGELVEWSRGVGTAFAAQSADDWWDVLGRLLLNDADDLQARAEQLQQAGHTLIGDYDCGTELSLAWAELYHPAESLASRLNQ